jgi:hypothetical protein
MKLAPVSSFNRVMTVVPSSQNLKKPTLLRPPMMPTYYTVSEQMCFSGENREETILICDDLNDENDSCFIIAKHQKNHLCSGHR